MFKLYKLVIGIYYINIIVLCESIIIIKIDKINNIP